MNHLTTVVKPGKTEDEFIVYWRNGLHKQGALTVVVKVHVPADHKVVAELAAMKHLLEEKAIFGEERGGKNLLLSISSGSAIRKLAKMQSTKAHLATYAKFLTTRFAGAEIKVEPDDNWIKPRALNNVERIEVNRAESSTIDLPHLGSVNITRHVVERLNQRLNYPGEEEVLRMLLKIARGPLVELQQSSDYIQKAKDKYGEAGRLFENKTLRCRLVIRQKKNGSRYLATAYFNA